MNMNTDGGYLSAKHLINHYPEKRNHRQKETTGSMVTAGFDIEVLFIAKRLGYRIQEVPVEWHYVETRRVSPIRDSIQGLLDILAIRINAMRGMY